ncbi:MAG: mevalonate kinase [Candidatus Thermoplasmatota archaeon]|nr:mevalonate kinase [Candidatus Thermoplasmatota archaeon]MDD5778165.1 mevalonate kinase [Candidatus Thermoplasmatota archaeon]
MGEGIGYGKVILFNEHFVVYGLPAIASAIGNKTVARVKPSPSGLVLLDERNATPGYKSEKKTQQQESLQNIFRAMNVDGNLEIWLGGDLRAASGVGASAASCAAIARAIADEYGLDYRDEAINRVAYEGEKGYHGTPSGLDNTVATYGGLVWFQSGEMERLRVPEPVEIVMGNTGVVANTKKAVAGVRERREQNREQYDRIFGQAHQLVQQARDDLVNGRWEKVGEHMNDNHALLQQIGVSSPELDMLVDIARREGAYGAKLTGGGLGGYMVALTPGKPLQERVARAIKNQGYDVVSTTIGVR